MIDSNSKWLRWKKISSLNFAIIIVCYPYTEHYILI